MNANNPIHAALSPVLSEAKAVLDSAPDKRAKNLMNVIQDEYGVHPMKAPREAILWAAGRVWTAGGDWKKQLADLNEARARKGLPHVYSSDVVKVEDDEPAMDAANQEAKQAKRKKDGATVWIVPHGDGKVWVSESKDDAKRGKGRADFAENYEAD